MTSGTSTWFRRRAPRLSGTLHIRDADGHEAVITLRGRDTLLTAGGTGLCGYGEAWAVNTAPSDAGAGLLIVYGPTDAVADRRSGICPAGRTISLGGAHFTWRPPAATSPPPVTPSPPATPPLPATEIPASRNGTAVPWHHSGMPLPAHHGGPGVPVLRAHTEAPAHHDATEAPVAGNPTEDPAHHDRVKVPVAGDHAEDPAHHDGVEVPVAGDHAEGPGDHDGCGGTISGGRTEVPKHHRRARIPAPRPATGDRQRNLRVPPPLLVPPERNVPARDEGGRSWGLGGRLRNMVRVVTQGRAAG